MIKRTEPLPRCPQCERPYSPRTRVPRLPSGEVRPCWECRGGITDARPRPLSTRWRGREFTGGDAA